MVFQYSSGVGRVVDSYVAPRVGALHVRRRPGGYDEDQNPDSSTQLERVRHHAIQVLEVTIATSDSEGLWHGGSGQVWLCR